MNYFENHGLPLVQLKEQRRELVMALMGRADLISDVEIAEIASLQQAIAAIEAVADDLDSRIEFLPPGRASLTFRVAKRRTNEKIGMVFGRRTVPPHMELIAGAAGR